MPRSSRPLSRAPTGVSFDSNAQTMADAREAWNTLADLLASIGDTATPVTIAINNGVLDPTNAVVRVQVDDAVDPENPGLDVSIVETISTTNVANGRCLYLSIADENEPITFRHLVSAGTTAGELQLAGGDDLLLTSRADWLVLQREGNRFIERRQKPASLSAFEQDIAGSGKAILDLRLKRITVKAYDPSGVQDGATRYMNSSNSYTATVFDRGCLLFFEASGTLTLPNSIGSWREDDIIYWAQGAASLQFVTAGTLVSPFNHDRGAGIGSLGSIILMDSSGPLRWWLNGATTSATGTGGGTTTPPPTAIQREIAQATSNQTVTTAAGQSATTYTTAVTLTHTPDDNEKWLYICRGTTSSTADSNNGSAFRLRNSAVSLGPSAFNVAQAGTPRWPGRVDSSMLFLAQTYGANPTSQSILAEMRPGNTSTTLSWGFPAILGLRLESDEFLFQAHNTGTQYITAGPDHSVYVDVLSVNPTLLADDYLIIAWLGWDADSLQGVKAKLVVGGVSYGERQMSKDFASWGYWNTIKKITGTGAAVSIELQFASRQTGSASQAYDCNVVILKKSRFEEWTVAEDDTSTSTTSASTWSNKAPAQKLVKAGWQHLVLADFTVTCSVADDAATGVHVRLQRNGTNVHTPASYALKQLGGLAAYGPQGFSNNLQQANSTAPGDTYQLQFSSVRDGDTVTMSAATVAILALRAI